MLRRVLMFYSNEDEETKYKVMREVCRLFSEKVSSETTTTDLAYERNRVIEKITNERDPMKDIKEESIEAALKVYPKFEKYIARIQNEKERFRAALKIALAGNIIEFGARDHEVNLERLEEEIMDVVKETPAIDDTDKIYEKVRYSETILYVTDNAGELVFDNIFIRELRNYAEVIVAPLSRPVQDDACIEDVKKVGIDCEILPRGNSIGVWFERTPEEFQRVWEEIGFIIAKGMGCYETLIDQPEITNGKVALLMKAKCKPVAEDVRVPLGALVVKVM